MEIIDSEAPSLLIVDSFYLFVYINCQILSEMLKVSDVQEIFEKNNKEL